MLLVQTGLLVSSVQVGLLVSLVRAALVASLVQTGGFAGVAGRQVGLQLSLGQAGLLVLWE